MCRFTIPFSGEGDVLINKAKQEVARAGGLLSGNASEGNFRAKTPIGSIEGSYYTQNGQMTLTITKKPLLISCGRIEKELASLLS